MADLKPVFRVLNTKTSRSIIVYRQEIAIDDKVVIIDVWTLNGDYMKFEEIDTNFTKDLSKKDIERLEEMLRKF